MQSSAAFYKEKSIVFWVRSRFVKHKNFFETPFKNLGGILFPETDSSLWKAALWGGSFLGETAQVRLVFPPFISPVSAQKAPADWHKSPPFRAKRA